MSKRKLSKKCVRKTLKRNTRNTRKTLKRNTRKTLKRNTRNTRKTLKRNTRNTRKTLKRNTRKTLKRNMRGGEFLDKIPIMDNQRWWLQSVEKIVKKWNCIASTLYSSEYNIDEEAAQLLFLFHVTMNELYSCTGRMHSQIQQLPITHYYPYSNKEKRKFPLPPPLEHKSEYYQLHINYLMEHINDPKMLDETCRVYLDYFKRKYEQESVDDELVALLTHVGSEQFAAALHKKGYASVDALADAEDDELAEIGLKKMKIRRLRNALDSRGPVPVPDPVQMQGDHETNITDFNSFLKEYLLSRPTLTVQRPYLDPGPTEINRSPTPL